MVLLSDRDETKAGRHRSRWGRPGRILPVRWMRVVAVVLIAGCAVAAGVALRLYTQPASHSTGRAGPTTSQGPGADLDPNATSAARSSAMPHGAQATATAPGQTGDASASPGASPSAAASPSAGVASVVAGTTASPVPPDAASGVSLSRASLDLGSVNSSGTVNVVNKGAGAATFTVGSTPSWLSVSPRAGSVGANGQAILTISLDRASAPSGPVSADVAVATTAGSGVASAVGSVRVTATVSGAPRITSVSASPAALVPRGCPAASGSTVTVLSVVATDSTGVFGVDVDANLPDGRKTHTSLSLSDSAGDSSTWSGSIGPSDTAGTLSYTVTVTNLDSRATATTRSLTVGACPA